MNHADAKKLKIGERVEIFPSTKDACSGTVIEVGYNAVKIAWDDQTFGIIHFRDMRDVRTK